MIEPQIIFDDLPGMSLWCASGDDVAALARDANLAAGRGMPLISVGVGDVATVWPWLEKMKVDIFARLYLGEKIPQSKMDERISALSRECASAFRSGARGVQIFMRAGDLSRFAAEISAVRDDLFFNKHMSIGLDLADIDAADWAAVFMGLRTIRADSLLVVDSRAPSPRSDFVGRLNAMFDAWDNDFHGAAHFSFGTNILRAEQALRLMSMVRPGLLPHARFFISSAGDAQ